MTQSKTPASPGLPGECLLAHWYLARRDTGQRQLSQRFSRRQRGRRGLRQGRHQGAPARPMEPGQDSEHQRPPEGFLTRPAAALRTASATDVRVRGPAVVSTDRLFPWAPSPPLRDAATADRRPLLSAAPVERRREGWQIPFSSSASCTPPPFAPPPLGVGRNGKSGIIARAARARPRGPWAKLGTGRGSMGFVCDTIAL